MALGDVLRLEAVLLVPRTDCRLSRSALPDETSNVACRWSVRGNSDDGFDPVATEPNEAATADAQAGDDKNESDRLTVGFCERTC